MDTAAQVADNERTEKIRAAKRSDATLEYQRRNVKEGMYACKKCKRRKVTMHLQQTRSADEPMTEFYTCIDCGH